MPSELNAYASSGEHNITQKFDDPFLTPSNEIIPEDLTNALDLCRYLYYLNPLYLRASQRVMRHFITDLKVPGEGDAEEKEDFKQYLKDDLEIFDLLAQVGDEYACYGNAFLRIHFPFSRYLEDKRDGNVVFYSVDSFESCDIKFKLKNMTYEIPDPRNNFETRVELPFIDTPTKNKKAIRIVKLDPRRMTIEHSFVSKKNRYIYNFEDLLKRDVKDGIIYQVNETPKSMLKAIKDDKAYRFNEDAIFHFREPTISGVSDYGWGFPETMKNFRAIYQAQIYRKVDEVIALDYLLPFRVFSPPAQGSEDSMNNGINSINNEVWKHHVESVIKVRRKDKTAMFAFPFPVNYQEFGAEGKQFTAKDLLDYQQNYLLDSLGYPQELFRGSLRIQQMPTAIRLFENSYWFVHNNFTNLLKWVSRKIQLFMGDKIFDIALEKPSLADDIDKKNTRLQLAMQGELPRSMVYQDLGIENPVDAVTERAEEDIRIQQEKTKIEEQAAREMEAEQAMSGGGSSGGSQQGGGPAQGGATPLNIEEQAQSLAAQWLGMDEGQRRQAMQSTRSQNENLYALAKQYMEDMRQQGESQGRQMTYQQFQQ